MTPVFGPIEPIEKNPLVIHGSWSHPVPRVATLRVGGALRDDRGRSALDGRDVIVKVETLPDTSVRILEMTIVGSEEKPITADSLRRFQLGELTAALRLYLGGVHANDWAEGFIHLIDVKDAIANPSAGELERYFESHAILSDLIPGRVDEALLAGLKKAGPRAVGSVEVVAELYVYAEREGLPPNTFIQRILGMNSATASRWITTARELDERKRIPENPRSRKATRKED